MPAVSILLGPARAGALNLWYGTKRLDLGDDRTFGTAFNGHCREFSLGLGKLAFESSMCRSSVVRIVAMAPSAGAYAPLLRVASEAPSVGGSMAPSVTRGYHPALPNIRPGHQPAEPRRCRRASPSGDASLSFCNFRGDSETDFKLIIGQLDHIIGVWHEGIHGGTHVPHDDPITRPGFITR